MTNIISYWNESEIKLGTEFGTLPRMYCPHHYVAVRDCFIEWSEPQDTIVAVLSSTLVDRGPANPNQEIHLIVHECKKASSFFHDTPAQPIRYKITNFDLDLSKFTINVLYNNKANQWGSPKSGPPPKITRISLKLDITDARDTRFLG